MDAIKILIIGCLVSVVSLNCKNKSSSNNTYSMNLTTKSFEWRPTECAPREYPIEIYSGTFLLNGELVANIPKGRTVKNGWGKIGSTYIVGEDFKPIPDKLDITWISLTENKFYKGSFDLPKDKMEALFNKGFLDRNNEHSTYSRIVCGMAPGGIVSIWLLGAGKIIEIEHFKAQETEISMEQFKPSGIQDREKYVMNRLNSLDNEVKIYLKKAGITYGKWTEYRKRYKWKPEFKLNSKGEFYEFFIDYVNGEHIYTVASNTELQDYQQLALPKYAKLYWKDNNKNVFGSKLYFDEEEVKNAFKNIDANSITKNLDMVFQVDKYNSEMTIHLISDNDSIKLEKTEIKIFETTE